MKKFLFDRQKEIHLAIILAGFLITFGVTRFYSTHFRYQVFVSGYHIHHFYFGAISLALGGIMAVLWGTNHKVVKFSCALLGLGLGLFADELGLLLNCTSSDRVCTYFFPDNFDLIGTIALVLSSLIVLIVLVKFFRNRRTERTRAEDVLS